MLLWPLERSLCAEGHSSAAAQPRFFLAGNGRLVLRHGHFDTMLDVRYRRADGTYDEAALAQIRHFFRSREDSREAPIALRLIELLAYVQNQYHPRQMILLSGYRSPEFNTDLRTAGRQVAQASLHTEGLAADVTFNGIDMARLWRRLRELHSGGAGYYRKGKFLHIDTGRPRFWEETTSRVSENLAAGNARIFLRTDFDRYSGLEGGILSLHSVTAFPLRIARQVRLIGTDRSAPLTIDPVDGTIERKDGCLVIAAPADAYQFRVAAASDVGATRGHVVVTTCEPRIEKTPAEIESNAIEMLAAH